MADTRPPRRAVFLDRDGVINRDVGYVYRIADFEFLPGAVEALKRLQALDYLLVVITNQSGIARGYFSEEQFQSLTTYMTCTLANQGVTIAATYHCPHFIAGKEPRFAVECNCRKPRPGLIERAALDLHIDVANSLLFGDKDTDIEAGLAAGVGRCIKLTDQRGLLWGTTIIDKSETERTNLSDVTVPSRQA